ncbi:MAG: 30S ribosomal protein S16 [Cyclobacteriaceae bacterium]|nr:30S ribosomal protein S16 [Cyclobacteriaceae bacterium]
MAVKIRLARRGRKKLARFDVVIADARAPRDGRFIEKIGTYNPLTVPASIELDEEKAFQWLMNGAQPSETVKAMLSYRGVMLRKHLQIGVIKGAFSQEEADRRLTEWKQAKEAKIQAKRERVVDTKKAQAQARKEAEAKIREARAEAIRKKAEAAAATTSESTPAESEAQTSETAADTEG